MGVGLVEEVTIELQAALLTGTQETDGRDDLAHGRGRETRRVVHEVAGPRLLNSVGSYILDSAVAHDGEREARRTVEAHAVVDLETAARTEIVLEVEEIVRRTGDLAVRDDAKAATGSDNDAVDATTTGAIIRERVTPRARKTTVPKPLAGGGKPLRPRERRDGDSSATAARIVEAESELRGELAPVHTRAGDDAPASVGTDGDVTDCDASRRGASRVRDEVPYGRTSNGCCSSGHRRRRPPSRSAA